MGTLLRRKKRILRGIKKLVEKSKGCKYIREMFKKAEQRDKENL